MNVFKFNISKQIIYLLGLAIFLSLTRILLFKSYSLIYILWNLFLATLPFIISYFLLQRFKEKKLPTFLLIIVFLLWLILLPNAPYLVTDLIHIGVVHTVPALYDAVFLFIVAWVGILLTFNSLFYIEQLMRFKYSILKTNVLISVIIFLTSFGIYLGRFLRFNSWDIFINHFSVLKGVWGILSDFLTNLTAFLYIFLFFIFIFVSYHGWKKSLKEL
jgi:uncharacterized membrane protein